MKKKIKLILRKEIEQLEINKKIILENKDKIIHKVKE